MDRDGESIANQIARFVPSQLELMGRMGIDLEDELLRVYPEFPRRPVERIWQNYLPPLSPALQRLVEGQT
jgi:hypothetical protein